MLKRIVTMLLIVLIPAAIILSVLSTNKQRKMDAEQRAKNLIFQKEQEKERLLSYEAEQVAKKAYLASLSESGIKEAGAQCVTEITVLMDEKEYFGGWDFLDYDPYNFDTLKNAIILGLNFSAYGSETSGALLVTAQIERIQMLIPRGRASFGFVTVNRVDGFSGVKEVLKHHVCRLNGKKNIKIYESDTIVL